MASKDLLSYTPEQLINIIEQQRDQMQSLTNETIWLQQDNNAHASQAIEYYEKAVEWQQYAGDLKKELEHLQDRDDKWRKGVKKAVEQRNEEREKYHHLNKSYSTLKEENANLKEVLEWARDLGKDMYNEYSALYNSYMLLLHYAHWITPSAWNEPLALCPGQEEGNPTPAGTPAEGTVPFTLPPEGCFTISPNIPTLIRMNVLIPPLLTIQPPCAPEIEITCGISEDKPPSVSGNDSPLSCSSETIAIDTELSAESGHLQTKPTCKVS